MAQTIKHKRGLKVNLPALNEAEIGFCTDTKEVFIGSSTGNIAVNPVQTTITGNAGTATKLAAARTIALSGDASGSTSFDGSANSTITAVLANSGATAGTYTKLTVNAKGLVTSATTLSASDIPSLTLSKVSDAGTAASKNTGTASGNVPLLDSSGKLPESVLPTLAITDTFEVASQTAMLALTAQIGDIVVRSDISKTYILKASPAATLANWVELKTPPDAVLSVNGSTGTVNITTITGNAGTATKLATARTINGVSFDGSANITVVDGTKAPVGHASIDMTYGISTATNYGHAMASNATPLINGTATIGTDNGKYAREGHIHPVQTSVSGNAGTATKLEAARTLSYTGDATGSNTFDGSANLSMALTLSNSGVTAGAYGPASASTLAFGDSIDLLQVTVDAKGRTTSVVNRAVTLPVAPTSVTGNAGTATKLATARTINGVAFDGSTNITLPIATATVNGLMSSTDKSKLDNIFNLIYPIGSIYMSASNTNPSSLFGGTWTAWGGGRVPVGINIADADFATVEKTGGSKDVTLTTSQMPGHTHTFSGSSVTTGSNDHTHSFSATSNSTGAHTHNSGWGRDKVLTYSLGNNNWSATTDNYSGVSSSVNTGSAGAHTHTVSGTTGSTEHTHTVATSGTNASAGGDTSHTNLQPYITCHMWKRTA